MASSLVKEDSSVPSGLSSLSSTGTGEKVGLRLCFGGHWLQQKDGSFKYVGGETYHEKIPAMRYAELMHYMSEKVNGAVTLKYSPPGEEVDVNNLVTCVDDDHVQEMFEEYFKAVKENNTPGKTFRLKMWLFAAKEEEVTPEDISKAKWGKMRLSTPRVGMYKQNVNISFGSFDSQGSSNNSSASAGTRSPHVMGRRMGYSGDTAYKLSLNDVEMQEKAAEDAVESMNAEQEAYTLAQMPHNMSVALATTYDSCGWPHDRSPFIKARVEAALPSLEGSDRETPRRQLSSRFLAGMDHNLGVGAPLATPPAWSLWGNHNDPMQTGTPNATSGGRRLYTQDSYKEDGDAEAEEEASRSQQNGGAATYPPKKRTQRSIHLPSQLGSDVGNAPHAYPYPTSDTLEAEAGHMEQLAAGMTDRVLLDWPPPHDGSEVPWGGRLQRTPSRMQITSDSVYRLPQTEIKVVHCIGEGTFGEVVLATNSVFGKIAVKWLKPAKMDKHKAKFWEEARMLAALNHPNVLRFYGVVITAYDDPTVVGIMTEYMQGSSLSNYLRPCMPKLSLIQRAELARGAVNGLAYLHEMNIVHFDLKPDNLLLDSPLEWNRATPGVKVADFGLSKQKFHKYVSGVRDLRGTLPYMAPELVSDPGHVTEAADIWSLGVVFWEMLTMETPFENLTPVEIVNGLGFGRLRPEIPSFCEPQWRGLLEGCLQMDAKDRLTLADIANMLDDITALPPNPHDFPTPSFL